METTSRSPRLGRPPEARGHTEVPSWAALPAQAPLVTRVCRGSVLLAEGPPALRRWLAPALGSVTLGRVFVTVHLTDRFIRHLVTVTCRDGFTTRVPLTLGCLKSGQRFPQTELNVSSRHQA